KNGDDLENGELDMAKSRGSLGERIKRSRVCYKKLSGAEAKIEKLTRNQKGELVSELFPVEEENDK
ncbi:MAG: exodeoxyribonuclease VII small subunit, partial [Nitrospinae bacterium]|nr:exodeoxyribonuclease VII small subunit [Nitrospinota bacterium]